MPVRDKRRMLGLSYSSIDIRRPPVESRDDLRLTFGKVNEVNHPKPLANNKMELESLPGASSMTEETSSILSMDVFILSVKPNKASIPERKVQDCCHFGSQNCPNSKLSEFYLLKKPSNLSENSHNHTTPTSYEQSFTYFKN